MNIIIAFLISVLTLFTVPPYATYDNNDTTLDTPIVELNNHTLREVFEGGNLISNSSLSSLTGWSSLYGTLALSNGELTITGNGLLLNMRIVNSYDSIVGDIYYGRVEVKVTYNNAPVYWNEPFYSPSLFTVPTINTFTANSFVGNALYSKWYYQQNFTSTTLQGANSFTIRKPYHINMTALGISSLTVSQMDYYYSLYQELIDFDGATITYFDYDLHDIALIIFFGFMWLSLIILLKRKVLN